MVYIVLLKERWIDGTSDDTLICGVHKERPSKERIKMYSEEYQVDEDCFEISEDLPIEESSGQGK